MRWIPASILMTSIAFAAVPYTLPIGVPAKASQVNRNFETLDSLIGDQIDQYTELRQTLVAQADSLRKDMVLLRQKVKADSQVIAERARVQSAADTGWKALNLPKGTVIGLLAAAGPDGYLPGSDKIWQQVESFGGIDGLPLAIAIPSAVAAPAPAAPAPAAIVADSAALAKAATDTAQPAVAVAPPAPAPVAAVVPSSNPAVTPALPKPVFHWFVKVR